MTQQQIQQIAAGQAYADQVGKKLPRAEAVTPNPGEALIWGADGFDKQIVFQVAPCKSERRRHRRKYAEGELPPERSFYFRGTNGQMNLRAQNLTWFRQLAAGVDDETWMYHLRQGDYSRWIEKAIKDPTLARAVEVIEQDASMTSQASRRLVTEAIEERYTLSATGT